MSEMWWDLAMVPIKNPDDENERRVALAGLVAMNKEVIAIKAESGYTVVGDPHPVGIVFVSHAEGAPMLCRRVGVYLEKTGD